MNKVVKQKQIGCLILCCMLFVCDGALRAQTFDRSVKTASNFEAAIPHPDQQKYVAEKLKQLEKRLLVIAEHLNAESMVRRHCAKIGPLAKSALRAHRILVDVGFGIITHWTNNR